MKNSFDSPIYGLPPLSRRRGPRLSPTASLAVRATTDGAPQILAVRDFGFRGFAIETPVPVTPGARWQFEFSTDHYLFCAVGVAVHCARRSSSEERWISGWEFPEQPGLDESLERLTQESVGVLTIE